jgi:hypothetical protein
LTAGAATVNGAASAGAYSLSIAKATNASPLVVGDLISFAGDSQSYVVTANATLAVGNTVVSISPALAVAKVGGEAMTLQPSHVANLAFHRDAIGFASRKLEDTKAGDNTNTMSISDPVSKLSMTLSIREEFERVRVSVSSLWGAALVRPELAIRIKG